MSEAKQPLVDTDNIIIINAITIIFATTIILRDELLARWSPAVPVSAVEVHYIPDHVLDLGKPEERPTLYLSQEKVHENPVNNACKLVLLEIVDLSLRGCEVTSFW